MFVSRPNRVPVPHAALALVLALLIAIAGQIESGVVAAQSDECHPAYGGCLAIVKDIDCDEIGYLEVEVWDVNEDPYRLDDASGPGNGITCDGDDGGDVAVDNAVPIGGNDSAMGIATDPGPVGTSDWTDAEKAYLDAFGPMFRAVGESVGRAGKLINAPQFDDALWRQNLAAEIAIWHVMYDQALRVSPPLAFTDIHPLALEYFRLCSEAGDYLTSWIATSDDSNLNQAIELFLQTAAPADQVQAMMKELRRVRGIPAP